VLGDVRVGLRGPHIGVAQLFLRRAGVRTTLQEVGGEGMPERVTTGSFVDAREANGPPRWRGQREPC